MNLDERVTRLTVKVRTARRQRARLRNRIADLERQVAELRRALDDRHDTALP